jgi:hypothetical protein
MHKIEWFALLIYIGRLGGKPGDDRDLAREIQFWPHRYGIPESWRDELIKSIGYPTSRALALERVTLRLRKYYATVHPVKHHQSNEKTVSE